MFIFIRATSVGIIYQFALTINTNPTALSRVLEPPNPKLHKLPTSIAKNGPRRTTRAHATVLPPQFQGPWPLSEAKHSNNFARPRETTLWRSPVDRFRMKLSWHRSAVPLINLDPPISIRETGDLLRLSEAW